MSLSKLASGVNSVDVADYSVMYL